LVWYFLCHKESLCSKHVLFLCHKAREVWRRLCFYEVIMRAYEIDRAGEAVLEFSLLMHDQDLSPVVTQNAREMIAITTCYLWWERCNLVHGETIQSASQISMGIRVLTIFFSYCFLRATIKRGGWTRPPRGFVKLNVDACFDHDELRALFGWSLGMIDEFSL
jgi:hypothetical protein